jgi:DNA-binding CsgD family transcriptional regulator
LRSSLGEPAFATAWEEGRAWSLDQAITAALGVIAAVEEQTCTVPLSAGAIGTAQGLTPREVEVLRLLAEGRTDQEIAAALFISPHTVTTHVKHLLAKLGVVSRAAAVAQAYRNDLI